MSRDGLKKAETKEQKANLLFQNYFPCNGRRRQNNRKIIDR
jgi:hypothetical protein